MKCPFCPHSDTAVVDSREADEGAVIRRRRRCLMCDKRFTTYERVELRMPAFSIGPFSFFSALLKKPLR